MALSAAVTEGHRAGQMIESVRAMFKQTPQEKTLASTSTISFARS